MCGHCGCGSGAKITALNVETGKTLEMSGDGNAHHASP